MPCLTSCCYGKNATTHVFQAMRQATNREKAAKIAEKDPFGPVDEQLDRSAASEAVNTAAMAQVRELQYSTQRRRNAFFWMELEGSMPFFLFDFLPIRVGARGNCTQFRHDTSFRGW